MFPGMNNKQMQRMMKQMGVEQEDLDAARVEITLSDKKLIFEDPEVAKVDMMGNATYQITGTPREEAVDTAPEITNDDLETVIEQTGCSLAEAREALEETSGDLAEAIMKLSS